MHPPADGAAAAPPLDAHGLALPAAAIAQLARPLGTAERCGVAAALLCSEADARFWTICAAAARRRRAAPAAAPAAAAPADAAAAAAAAAAGEGPEPPAATLPAGRGAALVG